jgi:hypothetical protein
MSFGKWIGGALGWAMGGPVGGIIGFALGAIADDGSFTAKKGPAQGKLPYEKYRHHTQQGDFASSLTTSVNFLRGSLEVLWLQNRSACSRRSFNRIFRYGRYANRSGIIWSTP